MGRTFSRESQIQELGIELIAVQLKAAEIARTINSLLSGINGDDAFNEHLTELGFQGSR